MCKIVLSVRLDWNLFQWNSKPFSRWKFIEPNVAKETAMASRERVWSSLGTWFFRRKRAITAHSRQLLFSMSQCTCSFCSARAENSKHENQWKCDMRVRHNKAEKSRSLFRFNVTTLSLIRTETLCQIRASKIARDIQSTCAPSPFKAALFHAIHLSRPRKKSFASREFHETHWVTQTEVRSWFWGFFHLSRHGRSLPECNTSSQRLVCWPLAEAVMALDSLPLYC